MKPDGAQLATDGASAEAGCRNRSVPEDHHEVITISKPVTQQLQAVGMDRMRVGDHIDLLMKAFQTHRGAACAFRRILELKTFAEDLGTDLTMSRQCARQAHPPNIVGSIEECHCRTIFVPCMNSLIQSLENRLGKNKMPNFYIFCTPSEKYQKQKEMNSSVSFHLSRKCMALTTL